MGKKNKKNRFTQNVEVDIVYSNNTLGEVDPADSLSGLRLAPEKVEAIQKIRSKLAASTGPPSTDTELEKLPTEKPFRAFVYNLSYSATEQDVAEFFSPLKVVNINMVNNDGGCRGFCFVDFDTRDELCKALQYSTTHLAGRPVNIRIATQNTNDRGSNFGRDRNMGSRNDSRGLGRGRGGSYRPAALRDVGDSSDDTGWQKGAALKTNTTQSTSANCERPRLTLMPRSTPRDMDPAVSDRSARIFGLAKPVDTAAKDRELEERLGINRLRSVPR